MEVKETAGDVAARSRPLQQRAPLAGLTVLLVDDHADSRDALRLVLQSVGARVRVARDGPDALEALATGVPDVVLADMRMPGTGGCELARRIRAIPALARVGLIAVSGVTEPASIAVARAAGFDGYVVKPIDGDALIQMLRERFTAPRPSKRRKLT
jgi:CheY-like chemotaxis protein